MGMAELPFPSPLLADDVVLLRPWRESDVPAQLEAFSDPVFRHHSDWQPLTEADARRQLEESECARRRGERVSFALVEPLDHGVLLGGASLNEVDLMGGRAGDAEGKPAQQRHRVSPGLTRTPQRGDPSDKLLRPCAYWGWAARTG